MRDPNPENISGEKWVGHTVEHKVDWGHMMLGVAGIAVAYVGYRVFVSGGDEDTEEIDGNVPGVE